MDPLDPRLHRGRHRQRDSQPTTRSTAVGVVAPQRSGMASGVNTTFRQIRIATGIAVYGSVFASALHQKLRQALANLPSLERHLPGVAIAI